MSRAWPPVPWQAVADAGQVPVLLVRHGRTAWNHEGRFLGCADVPLDDEGHSGARRLAQRLGHLPRQGLYTSPLLRAVQTAAALGEPQAVPGLQELDQGELEGSTFAPALARFPDFFLRWRQDPSSVRVPGGETLAECEGRALEALRGVVNRHRPGEPLVVVTHQVVIGLLVLKAAGRHPREVFQVKHDNCAFSLLGVAPDGELTLHLFHDRAHVEPGAG